MVFKNILLKIKLYNIFDNKIKLKEKINKLTNLFYFPKYQINKILIKTSKLIFSFIFCFL